MGCDYYIFKLLHVFFNETDYLEIQLDIERGYFDDLQFDEDADDYDEKVVEHIKEVLTPKVAPIMIYENGSFNKSSCESKYRLMVETEIFEHDKVWSDIIKIIKVEERRER